MNEYAPAPEGMTVRDFLDIINKMKLLKHGTSRRIILALSKAERRNVWAQLVGLPKTTTQRSIDRLRARGFIIDTSSSFSENTWKWIKTIDISADNRKLTKVYRYAPLTHKAVYRWNPEFMKAFRAVLTNYRQSGGVVINRWERAHIRFPLKNLMNSMRLDPTGAQNA